MLTFFSACMKRNVTLLCICKKHEMVLLSFCKKHDVTLLSISRTRDWYGPLLKDIPFVPGRHYVFEAYVKLLNDAPGKPWQKIKTVIKMTLPEKGQ